MAVSKIVSGMAFGTLIVLLFMLGMGAIDEITNRTIFAFAGLLVVGLGSTLATLGTEHQQVKQKEQIQQLSDLTRRYEGRIVKLEIRAGFITPPPKPPIAETS